MKWQLLAISVFLTATSAFAEEKYLDSSDIEMLEEKVAEATQAQRITQEQAEEMALNKAATYEVFSSVSAENLTENVLNKLKESKMPYYSVEVMAPGNQAENYRVEVTEYFGKVE
ncbi:hypothetical protein KCN56_02685 [Photobacterium galatheae]|uniref:hypothetical protein n=1 Tax=Photobacterium galatheae TaxID=1654360 RepID=UPI00202CBDCB|nr:hypothetical protein [Photobacterium galatheae]MCM0147476.1 hypothetical protein [Photobacterium galatheae]